MVRHGVPTPWSDATCRDSRVVSRRPQHTRPVRARPDGEERRVPRQTPGPPCADCQAIGPRRSHRRRARTWPSPQMIPIPRAARPGPRSCLESEGRNPPRPDPIDGRAMSVSRDEGGEVEPAEPRGRALHRAGNQAVVAVSAVDAGPHIIRGSRAGAVDRHIDAAGGTRPHDVPAEARRVAGTRAGHCGRASGPRSARRAGRSSKSPEQAGG
jgi:hypothetical protein